MNILESLIHIQLHDWLDIAILSFAIYHLILILQGTRTVRILMGLLLVGLFYYLSIKFHLNGIFWVLQSIFQSIVLVIIVLFQPEFRTALERVRLPYLRAQTKSLDKHKDFSKQLSSLLTHLSSQYIGGLIVLQQHTGLKEYYASGTKIMAEFSLPLCSAIFQKESPLHDGAIIITNQNTIAYASCILPLSTQIDLPKHYGTRHRAALGLSQEADAIILVVSEERGSISLVYRDHIYDNLTASEIEDKLLSLFTG